VKILSNDFFFVNESENLWEEIEDYLVEKKKEISDKPLKRLRKEEFNKK